MSLRRCIIRKLLALIPASLVAVTALAVLGHSQISPPVTEESWSLTGSLNTNRYGHTATLLPNGKVLVAGGGGFPCSGGFCFSTVNASAELYDPETEMWSYTGILSRRAYHTATLLPSGEVLAVGGYNWGFDIGHFELVRTAELYDPATGKWRPTTGPATIIGDNRATLLPNGKVLVVGSLNSNLVEYGAELYDPATEMWNRTSAPGIFGPLELLNNGMVLSVSGKSAELYDPASESWTSAASLNVIRSADTLTLLRNGKVLVTGTSENSAFSSELYDPDTGVWIVTGSLTQVGGAATLLRDGRVLLSGGVDSFFSVRNAELYDPATGAWSPASNLITARQAHTATLLPDGRVLAVGGVDGDFDILTKFLGSAELYGLVAIPRISSASVSGKRLFVFGENFEPGAVILVNGEQQKTRNDDQDPKSTVIGRKAGTKVKPGDKLQVRNPNGTVSDELTFTGI